MDFSTTVTLSTALLIGLGIGIAILLAMLFRTEQIVNHRIREWETSRLDAETKKLREQLLHESDLALRTWKTEYAGKIRQDAINRSKSVIAGKVTENIAPFFESFPYNPKDARFIGSPIDFIVFDGLDEAGNVDEIIFVEPKDTVKQAVNKAESDSPGNSRGPR